MGFETFFVSLLVSLVGVGDDFVHEAYGLAILQVAENASDDAANSGAGEEAETIFLRHSGLCAYFPNEPGNPNEEKGKCSKRDSNSHGHFCPKDFKSFVSTIPPFERP